MEANLCAGVIVGVHGIKGTLKFIRECETDEILAPGSKLTKRSRTDAPDTVTVRWAKPSGKYHLLSLEGVEDRNQAESLVGAALYFEKSALPPLEEGAYYWFELMGMTVMDETDADIGRIADIIATGANDVYVVRNGDRETLVPAIASVVTSVDVKTGVMRVQLPEGL